MNAAKRASKYPVKSRARTRCGPGRAGHRGRGPETARCPIAIEGFGEASAKTVYLCYDWPFDGESATPDVSADGAPAILVVANTGEPTTHGSYPHNRCAARAIDTYLLNGAIPGSGC